MPQRFLEFLLIEFVSLKRFPLDHISDISTIDSESVDFHRVPVLNSALHHADMAELVDATDLKSVIRIWCEGSSPSSATNLKGG